VADSKADGQGRRVGRPTVTPYRPRDDRVPVDLCDLVDRHISRATESDPALRRYRLVLRELCAVGMVLAFCGTALLLGIIAVVRLVGLSPWVAGGLGLLGTVTAVGVGRLRAARDREP
jgi:hypothetical protein